MAKFRDFLVQAGFFDHLKTMRIEARFGVDGVRGILRLWEYTAMNHPTGELGRVSNLDIGLMCKMGPRSEEFGAALVSTEDVSGFVDRDSSGYVMVHDWLANQPTIRSNLSKSEKARERHPEKYVGDTDEAPETDAGVTGRSSDHDRTIIGGSSVDDGGVTRGLSRVPASQPASQPSSQPALPPVAEESAHTSPSAPPAPPEPLKEPPAAETEEPPSPTKPKGPPDWMREVADHWVQVAKVNRYAGCERIMLTDKRRKAMGARHVDWKFRAHIALDRMIEDPDPFWAGGVDGHGWVADFDWFIRPDTVEKILERRPPLRGMEALGWRPGKGWRSEDPNDYTEDQWRRIVTEWQEGDPWPPGRPEDWPARISQVWKAGVKAEDERRIDAELKARREERNGVRS